MKPLLLIPALATLPALAVLDARAEGEGEGSDGVNQPIGTIVETALAADDFNLLAAALVAGDLVDDLNAGGLFTVLAPTDAAFSALGQDTLDFLLDPANRDLLRLILKYHVVEGRYPQARFSEVSNAVTLNGQRLDLSVIEGSGVAVDGVPVAAGDVQATNGIIHVIDEVLMPSTQDIVETAVAGDFQSLVLAVQAAGLVQALQSDGPFTVFAPTDEAFEALPKGALRALLLEKNRETLTRILTYHVIPNRRVYSDQLENGAYRTLEGSRVDVNRTGKGVQVDRAVVQIPDVEAANGVIHVIDRVLMP